MRVIGVIDLLAGRAVHARGGRRERYEPVGDVAGVDVQGDPIALAARYAALGVQELYVADLDAIAGRPPAAGIVRRLGLPVWLDAGVGTTAGARACLAWGASRVVVGLETLPAWDALRAIAGEIGSDRTAFSLDLRDRIPIGAMSGAPAALAAHAVEAGAGAVIVLDLARVGMHAGPDVELLAEIRRAGPDVPLIAGGGVRDASDLEPLTQIGCAAALVATALHRGLLHVSATR
jgi:phosphoribosylformimino-5-aminoimidazole carboxamide ribotide isomerase